MKVCSVIGFPLGATPTQSKLQELEFCILKGATEIDMVVNIGYYKDYIGTVDIFLLEQEVDGFKRSYGIRLEEAYPKEINGNDLSAGPATAALKLTIQMQYKYWTEVTRQIDKPTSNLADF